VTSLIDELGLPQADKDFLTKSLTDPANDASAQRFISQRQRHDEFTRRTQDWSTERANLERRVNDETARYAQDLQDANGKLAQVARDLETSRINESTAQARIQKIKTMYNLSDDDLPPAEASGNRPLPEPVPHLTADAVNGILKKFRDDLMKEFRPEFEAFPRVAALMDDIDAQHRDLLGKRLTYDEKQELIKTAQVENGPSLLKAWRDKYDIATIEKQREREEWTRTERQKWEDERRAKDSADALAGVRRHSANQPATVSPVLNRKFTEHPTTLERPGTAPVPSPPAPVQSEAPKLTGAERAAAKFLERRAANIPMGERAPLPTRT